MPKTLSQDKAPASPEADRSGWKPASMSWELGVRPGPARAAFQTEARHLSREMPGRTVRKR